MVEGGSIEICTLFQLPRTLRRLAELKSWHRSRCSYWRPPEAYILQGRASQQWAKDNLNAQNLISDHANEPELKAPHQSLERILTYPE